MNKYINYSLLIFSSLLLSWIIPYGYDFITQKSDNPQFIIYSSIDKDFISQKIIKEDSFVYYDRKGNMFSQYQMDSLIPSIGYRMLILQKRMPDTILGQRITPQEFTLHNFFFSHSPEDINKKSPKLYPLLESSPKRIELSLPNDVFRLTNEGIQFINLKTNKILKQKSEIYTNEMKKNGVVFPIKVISGNPTPLKEYDNGYILSDNKNQLFQLKMSKGKPIIIKIYNNIKCVAKNIFVTEYPDKRFIAFISDKENKLYAIDNDTKTLKKLGIPSFDPSKDNLIILGNIFDWNVEINRHGNRFIYALNNNNLCLLDSMKVDKKISFWQNLSKYIFPIKISFTSVDDQYFSPRFEIKNIKYSIFLNIGFLIIYLYYYRIKKYRKPSYLNFILIAIFGFIGFIVNISLARKIK